MAEQRHALVTWHGDLQTGGGTIDYVSSGVFSRMPVSWAARTGPHNGKTSPEELLAAAHGACFSMAFSARLAKNGTPATTLNVKAEVTFDNASGGWKVTRSLITVQGDVPGPGNDSVLIGIPSDVVTTSAVDASPPDRKM